ncbi:hypothetical protein [Nonomuraea sp. NEAU-A123]|uniref:hypothetical protein n=1 Tax=Nonomuraea sp. NEAU-A123 TaxID=2839649 RepID=UPI001BE497B5|nr:hypothetical protein [Nonomuraea sp. NEAU-A123]MBT2231217.1 hypothetical protein [Nonomuraea sp. NEAU-A123]
MKGALGLCLVVLAATGCGGVDQSTFVGADPRVIVDAERDISLEMNIPGVLGYDAKSKCLHMTLTGGHGQVVAPVWPAGSKPVIEHGKHGVAVPGAGSILEGDRVYGDAYVARTTDAFDHLSLPVDCVPPNRAFVFITLDQSPAEPART